MTDRPPNEALCALCKVPYRLGMSAVCYKCGHAHGSTLEEPALRDEIATSERKLALLAGLFLLSVPFFFAQEWLRSLVDNHASLQLLAWLLELVAPLLPVLSLGLSANEWHRYRALKRSGR